jgi:hypothetical protein
VTELLNAYHEYFEEFHDEGDEVLVSDSLPTETQDQLMDDSDMGDFGMEIEANMDPKQLARALGFKHRLPFSFNLYRHNLGTSLWDNESLFKLHADADQPLPQYIEFLKLHWHQLAGVHSIVRSVFLEQPDNSHPTGVLIADEVGLGKTAQSITFIAFMNQILYVQSKGLSLPPIIGKIYFSSSQIAFYSHFPSGAAVSRYQPNHSESTTPHSLPRNYCWAMGQRAQGSVYSVEHRHLPLR